VVVQTAAVFFPALAAIRIDPIEIGRSECRNLRREEGDEPSDRMLAGPVIDFGGSAE
jgi:hypothetical protein